jgi:hypothetical protein
MPFRSNGCQQPECGTDADVLIYTPGYPAPMARACFDHLGALIRKDREAPGSVENYDLVVCHPEHIRNLPPWRTT